MIRLTAIFLFSFISLVAYSQEICNNGIDDDFDGFIDCYDGSCANDPACDGIFLGNDATCQSPPPVFPKFTMSLDFASPNETTNHLARMAIGDLDRDGVPEIVTMNRYTNTIYILNGDNGTVKRKNDTIQFEPYWEVAIANIDNDNCGEIYFIGYMDEISVTTGTGKKKKTTILRQKGVYMLAYDCNLNFIWRTKDPLPNDPINFGIADFDGDGKEEIYAKDEIYDAKTGTRIVKTTASSYTKINGGPVAVNITGDSKQELVIGLAIYQVNLGARTADAGSLTLLQSRAEYFIRDSYNATSIADYNLDGFLDVLASGSTVGHDKNTTVFLWDVKNNTLKTYSDPQPALGTDYTNGWINGTGRLNIADLDGVNGMNASFVSGRFLYALDENFNLLWRVNINEETSGYTGCTLFDFNGDGKAEIVYRDERFLYIIEGADGSIYSQQACISRTNREYPIVADVDADGSTELCVTCGFNDTDASTNFNDLTYSRYSHVRVFKSAAEPWVPARRVWNQHGYFVVNVNDDLTIPTSLQAHHLVFSTGNCTQGPNRPLNKFLNQSPYLNSEGCPTYASADIAFSVAPTIIPPTCPNLNFTVSFKITNLGDVSITGDIPITFYTTNPKRAGAVKLNTITASVTKLQKGDIFSVDNATVTGIGSDSLYVVLNDAGTTVPTPIVLPNTTFFECDYDNIRGVKVRPLPVSITAVEVNGNEKCSAVSNGTARAFVPIGGGGENTADYNFYWSIGAVAKPIASIDYVGPIYAGIPDGTYTVYARHKTANCNSDTTQVVVSAIPSILPDVTVTALANQTACSPPNGKMEATIAGGGAGFTIDWYDIALNPLGISGATANNLVAGSYLVVISKGGCTKTSLPATIGGPQVPDAQASVLQNVLDCSNPNSGSITSEAIIGGVVQNPAAYTFSWFQYNNLTGVQGSALPVANGTGPTRTGLPVGFYQVEVKDNITQCLSTLKPIVEVKSQTVIPDPPQIVILSSQTSCDPLAVNGVMTANVFIGGVLQNPADFTFEWFKGQNTLPANKVTTVSDVNGKTVNQVAGGGIPYTVKVTNAFNCSATSDLPITENVVTPVVTLAQLSPNSICNPAKATSLYNGSVQATVTFGGSPVTLPDPNYKFTWRDPSNAIIAVTDDKNPILSGIADGNAYSVTVERTDLKCISNADSEPVLKTTVLPLLTTSSTGSNNCDATLTPDGTVTVAVTNSVPGDIFTYQWYSGNAIVPANALSAATNNGDKATAIKVGGPTGAPNQYLVNVLNTKSGCESTAIQFVADISVVPVLSFASVTPNSVCSPATSFNGALVAQVDNQIGPISDYVFTWYNGAANTPGNENLTSTSTALNKLDAGFYTVETKNNKTGCKSAPISNQVPDIKIYPALSLTSTGSNNCDPALTPDGTATATVTNIAGAETYGFQWYSGNAVVPANILGAANNGTSATAIKLGGPTGAPKSYTVFVTNNATGCTNFSTVAVADISVIPVISFASVTPNSICSPSTLFNGALVAQVDNQIGAITDYSFTWYNGATNAPGNKNLTSTSTGLNKLDAGTYTVETTNTVTGCKSSPISNMVPDVKVYPNLSLTSTGSNNCDPLLTPDGTATATVTNIAGAETYSFKWHTGNAVVPANALGAANNGTSATAIKLGGPTGAPNPYTVLVTNNSTGCTNFSTVAVADISIVPVLSFTNVTPNTICSPSSAFNGSLTVQVDNQVGVIGDYVFTWYNGNTNAPASENTASTTTLLSQLDAGFYTVETTNTKTGCSSLPATNQVPNAKVLPVIAITSTGSNTCDPLLTPDGAITANVTNGGVSFSYQWSAVAPTTAITNVANNANQQTAINLGGPTNAPNSYQVLVTNNATGCQNTAIGLVADVSQKPTLTLASTPNGICDITVAGGPIAFNGHLDVTAVNHPFLGSSAITYEWQTADINGVLTGATGSNAASLTQRQAGKYAVRVKVNSLGCTSDYVVDEILDNLPVVNVVTNVQGSTNCAPAVNGNGLAEVTSPVGATIAYQWYDGTLVAPGQLILGKTAALLGNDLQGGASANYTVLVTNLSNGCKNNAVVNVPDLKVTPTIAVSLVANNTVCDIVGLDPDGELQATVGGVGANYTVHWTGGAPKAVVAGAHDFRFTLLKADNYTAYVQDDDTGCQSVTAASIVGNNFTYPNVTFTVTPQTSCNALAPNGAVTAADGIVTASRTFEWFTGASVLPASGLSVDGGDPVNQIDDLASGDFTVRITNDNTGCASVASTNVPTQITVPVVSFAGVSDVTSCSAPNGAATASVANLSSPTNYDIYYVFTSVFTGAAYPTAPGDIKVAVDPLNHTYTNFTNQNAAPTARTGLLPGYLTALAVDKNTSCESNPATQEIKDMTTKSNITVSVTAEPGICGSGSGGLDPTVGPLAPASYTYEWYAGSPTDLLPINFFNGPGFNLPDFAGGQIYGDGRINLGVNGGDPSIGSGTYTLVVYDANGCGTYHTDFIPVQSVPVLSVAPTDITRCDISNGAIDVEVTSGTSVAGYSLEIFSGNDATGASLGSIGFSPLNTTLTVSNLPEGPYFIQLVDGDLGVGVCPMGQSQQLIKTVKSPVVSIDNIIGNTSCTPATSSDGQVQLTVTTANGDTSPAAGKSYRVTNINPAVGAFPFTIGTGLSGQTTGLLTGFDPSTVTASYTITVQDFTSKCATDVTFAIPDNQDLPGAMTVSATPETLCAPGSNGAALANTTEAETEFDFDWYSDPAATTSVLAAPVAGDGANTGGELLNRTKLASAGTDWPLNVTNGLGAGDIAFFVRAVRNATAASGVGCPTEIKQVVIPDQHLVPGLALVPTFNSFCSAVNPGDIGDGSIAITADANPNLAGTQNAAGGFTFSWTNANASLATPQDLAVNTLTIPDLATGSYAITARNDETGCIISATEDVDAAPFSISITDTDIANQLICDPNGQVDVVQITIDRTPASLADDVQTSALPLTTLYDFEWYSATVGDPTTFVATPLQDGTATDINEQSLVTGGAAGQFATMGAGTYYVKATRKAGSGLAEGCQSFPLRVDVQDQHKNPLVTLAPFSNTSCSPAGEGVIEITVTDATDPSFGPVFTYDYDWTSGGIADAAGNNGDATGADDVKNNLLEGTYALIVTNPASGCFTPATVEIIKNATPVFTQNVAVVDQISCDPAGDGSMNVTSVTLRDRNNVVQTSGVDFNITDFEFDWNRGAIAFTQTTAGTALNVGNYDATAGGFGIPIGAGTYTVVSRRVNGTPGAGCESAPYQVTIADKRLFPVITLTPFANTSCDPLADEGEISVKVTDATAVAGPHTFTYAWNAGNPVALGTTLTNDGDADGTDGDGDNPTTLKEGTYQVTITNDQSFCASTASTTLFKNSTPVFTQQVLATNQVLCGNDGSLQVTEVKLIDRNGTVQSNTAGDFPLTDFQFNWTKPAIAFAQTTPGTTLNVGNYPAISFGEYYVSAERVTGAPGAKCQSTPFKVDILDRRIFPVATLTPFANTSCDPAFFEGEITVKVTDGTTVPGPFTYSYVWDNLANPVSIATAAPGTNNGNALGTDGDEDNPSNLKEGTYKLTVTNNQSGCSSSSTTTLFKNSTPVFTQQVLAANQVLCGNDGSLQVTEVKLVDRNGSVQSNTNGDFALSDFQFNWTKPAIAFAQTTAGVTLDVTNYPNISFGEYYVSAERINGFPGKNCESTPFKVDILDRRIFPVGTLTPFANTSCDPAFPEGAISVKVSDGTTVPGPFTYTYTWDNVGNPTPIVTLSPGVNDGDAVSTDGDEDEPTNLLEGNYTVAIRNNQSGCQSNATTTIFKNATPIFIPQATATPQILCSADGSIEVDVVSLTDRNGVTQTANLADFDFGWARATLANQVATTQGLNGAVAGGTILDRTIYNQIGFDTYFITATRVTGNVGRGCASAPFRADILDNRVFPEVTVATIPNSSCSVLLPNGSVTINASEPNGTNTGPYTFAWVLNGGAVSPASVQTDTNNSSVLANALDGDYVLTATNTITNCPVSRPVEVLLDPSRSTPNIIDVLTVDPLDCNPTGSATVTKITLGSITNSSLYPPNLPPNNEVTGAGLLAFDYEWYQGSFAAGNQLPIGGPPFTVTPNINSLVVGTYYVLVHDPATDCRSGLREVIINGGSIVYPVLDVVQVAKQVGCLTTTGSASLAATADGQTDANANYSFTWFGNPDNTPPSIAATSTIGSLQAGTYSVTVLDNTTSCTASAAYIVTDDTEEFRPVVSMGSQPRTLCVGTDGAILARVLNIDPSYPYPYNNTTFTADLYFGATPNLNAAPDVPNMSLINGFFANFLESGLNEGAYTVRITDNNTGCVGVGTDEIKDARKYPTLAIEEIAPMTNCDPARPNGVALATADGTFVGFQFDWYEGNSVTGAPVYTGAQYGDVKALPQVYTVRATDINSGCTSDLAASVKDGTVPILAPTIEVLSNVTSCLIDNGALSTYVGTDRNTKDYVFDWYDGTSENPPADYVGEIYTDLAKGNYSVTATSLITGCKSPLTTGEIIIEQQFPDFNFYVQNSSCDKNDGYASLIMVSDVPVETIEWSNQVGPFLVGPNFTDAAAGVYTVTATSFLGCATTKDVEILPDIHAYNGVSRNNDGRNEIFQIDCIQNFPNNIVKIFNRAGTLVYEAQGYDNSNTFFDGKSNKGISPMGVNLPDGTYYYIVDKRDGSKPIAGYLEIVK